MKWRVSRFLSIFPSTLVTGIFWGTWFSLSRSFASLARLALILAGVLFFPNEPSEGN